MYLECLHLGGRAGGRDGRGKVLWRVLLLLRRVVREIGGDAARVAPGVRKGEVGGLLGVEKGIRVGRHRGGGDHVDVLSADGGGEEAAGLPQCLCCCG